MQGFPSAEELVVPEDPYFTVLSLKADLCLSGQGDLSGTAEPVPQNTGSGAPPPETGQRHPDAAAVQSHQHLHHRRRRFAVPLHHEVDNEVCVELQRAGDDLAVVEIALVNAQHAAPEIDLHQPLFEADDALVRSDTRTERVRPVPHTPPDARRPEVLFEHESGFVLLRGCGRCESHACQQESAELRQESSGVSRLIPCRGDPPPGSTEGRAHARFPQPRSGGSM